MPRAPSALFSCVLTYSFLSNVSRLTIVILDCLNLQFLSCYGDLVNTSTELPHTSYLLKFKTASSNPQITSSNSQVTSSNLRVTSLNDDFWVQIHGNEFKSTSYEYDSQVKSSNRPTEMKTHGNSRTNYLGFELISVAYLNFWRDLQSMSWSCIFFKNYF